MISQYCPEVWEWYRKRRIVRDGPSIGYWMSEGGRLFDQLYLTRPIVDIRRQEDWLRTVYCRT